LANAAGIRNPHTSPCRIPDEWYYFIAAANLNAWFIPRYHHASALQLIFAKRFVVDPELGSPEKTKWRDPGATSKCHQFSTFSPQTARATASTTL